MTYSNPLDFISDFVTKTGVDPRGNKGSEFLAVLNSIFRTQLQKLPKGAVDVIEAAKPTRRLD
jgi:hypothetical protein